MPIIYCHHKKDQAHDDDVGEVEKDAEDDDSNKTQLVDLVIQKQLRCI